VSDLVSATGVGEEEVSKVMVAIGLDNVLKGTKSVLTSEHANIKNIRLAFKPNDSLVIAC